jgi:hypothetical protein
MRTMGLPGIQLVGLVVLFAVIGLLARRTRRGDEAEPMTSVVRVSMRGGGDPAVLGDPLVTIVAGDPVQIAVVMGAIADFFDKSGQHEDARCCSADGENAPEKICKPGPVPRAS